MQILRFFLSAFLLPCGLYRLLGFKNLIHTHPQVFSRLEGRDIFLIDKDLITCAGIPACSRGAVFYGERTETSQFDTLSARERRNNLIENYANNKFDIPLKQVRILSCNFFNKL